MVEVSGGWEQGRLTLDGWCEGGLGQQEVDCGGGDNARKIGRSGEPR